MPPASTTFLVPVATFPVGAFLVATFLVAVFLVTVFFVALFFGAVFRAADFLVADFLVADFLVAGFFAEAFLATDFFVADTNMPFLNRWAKELCSTGFDLFTPSGPTCVPGRYRLFIVKRELSPEHSASPKKAENFIRRQRSILAR